MRDPKSYSVAQYVAVLKRLERKISAANRSMLKAHAEASRHRLSVDDLAKSAGSTSPQMAYGGYGQLNRQIANQLDPKTRSARPGEQIWTRYIGIDRRDPVTEKVVWTMHKNVVLALRELGWAATTRRPVKSEDSPSTLRHCFLFVARPEQRPEKVTARRGANWSCSKTAKPGDRVLVHVAGIGICHEWQITSAPEHDRSWGYVGKVKFVRNIDPPIRIETLRTAVPKHSWAPPHLNFRGYRSILVPPTVEVIVRKLSGKFRKKDPLLNSTPQVTTTLQSVEKTFLAEVRKAMRRSAAARHARLQKSPALPEKILVQTVAFRRNADVVAEVLWRAEGHCEGCKAAAPFIRNSDKSPYLEVHHRLRLSEGGEDTVQNAIALCPNCHRERHFG